MPLPVLPFSKRPPPPDEYLLRSGDFEAVRHDSYSGARPHPSYAPQAIPPAPRAPVFARHSGAPSPYGFAQSQQSHFGTGQYGDLSAPPPPHSLAPVAMGGMSPDSTGRNFAHTVSRTNGTVVVREKPSLKWGVMIALSGALLGGVLGLTMDARRHDARAAAAAAEARDSAPPSAIAAALPNAAGIANAPNAANALGVAAPRPVAPPAVAPAVAVAATGLPANVIAPPPPTVLAAVAPVVVAPKTTEPVAPKTHAAKAAAPKSHILAAKVQTPKAPPSEKAEKPEAPEPTPTKTAKADPPATKPKKEAASTSDAMKILEAANKDTTNTL